MNLIPFRRHKRDMPEPTTVRFVRFTHPREIAEYGFDGNRPLKEERSSSGFLLPWIAIDAERDRRVHGGQSELVIQGEYVDDATGFRSPAVAVNPAWMEARGYRRETFIRNGKTTYGPWTMA